MIFRKTCDDCKKGRHKKCDGIITNDEDNEFCICGCNLVVCDK